LLRDREKVAKIAKLIDPVVRKVDSLVGEKVVRYPSPAHRYFIRT